ncbi:FAD-dependent monooxygenase [Phycicoccus sp. CSK15P-2]|uniref:FAD-dependent monooxygenase n=1 Tax=Phycicoccus sp. CSK15P-2 TaxID=2807627 RepID=UPI001951B193|nr:FAD-dependent monooxygenase [Phycicoccus sp. CSK15P-2]MBM6403277.1 FAD-dependent monooxygenase [Phycicoccus sp. CSK15P-2]
MTRHIDRIDVLVVGAGPTGLTLACGLARDGVQCRVVDRTPEYNTASKAKTIQPRALEVLDDLDAADHVLAQGVVDLPMHVHEDDGSVTERPGISIRVTDPVGVPYPDPLWIGQFDVEAALRDRLAFSGVEVELGSEVTGLRVDADGVDVDLWVDGHPTRIRARYVVACDGGRSTVRELLGLELPGRTNEAERWYLGDVRTEGTLDRGAMHVWPNPDGMVGLTPLPGTDLWQFQAPIPEDVTEPDVPSREHYQRMLDERAGAGTVTLSDATWLSVYRTNVRMLESYGAGPVLFAGDAAHVHPPAGGQGMNTGIQDGYNLAWKLSTVLRGADPRLLLSYSEERAPVARAVLDDSAGKMSLTSRAGTDGAGRLSATLGSLSDDLTSGLPVAYPDSTLTYRGSMPNTVLPAGSRAPDASGIVGVDDHGHFFEGRMFDLLRGSHWTLLVFDHAGPLLLDGAGEGHLRVLRFTEDGTGTLRDTRGEVRRGYAPRPEELVLVRPDGYVAARVPASQELGLVGHLSTFRPADVA